MIEKIYIQNFKSIEKLEIHCNIDFNVIIGENNIGKTSIFEAIHLWKTCYNAHIVKNKKSFYSNSQNIPFKDMEYLRISDDMDLFNFGCKPKEAELTIRLTVKYDVDIFELGFLISKVQKTDNAYFQVKYENYESFVSFSEKMVASGYNLTNGIVICESRPISSIIAKEPYMYKDQVLEKISKNKGYEVLRNKIIKSPIHVEEHITNIMGQAYKFNETDKDNKTYIRLTVNGTNILSQGSGFLQIAEIFSSFEFSEAAIYVLLIDEPDSHIHMKLQKKLIEEFRNIQNSQLFIITHNEKFLDNVKDEEVLFVNNKGKQSGVIARLPQGGKNLVMNDLAGAIDSIDMLRYVNKIVILEGKTDIEFFENLLPKYLQYTNKDKPNTYIDKVNGIDSLNDKLLTYSTAFNELVSYETKWVVIRDNDCVPISLQERVKNCNLGYLRSANKELYFQNGYGVESTFVSEIEMFAKLLKKYYSLEEEALDTIKQIITDLNCLYASKILICTDEIHLEFKTHFERQKLDREEKVYETLELNHVLGEINNENIQYIMTKPILNSYLTDLNNRMFTNFALSMTPLNAETILSFYYGSVSSINDIYECHIHLLESIC